MASSVIPQARELNVPDAPKITTLEFYRQLIDNVSAQIQYVDGELAAASGSSNQEQVRNLYECVHNIRSRAEQASALVTGILQGDAATLQAVHGSLNAAGETVKKMEALVESIKELENELKEAQYDYYRIVADLLTDVQEQMARFKEHAAVQQVILIQDKIDAIETELQRQVQWSCREIGPLLSSDKNEGDPEAPAAADMLIDLQELSQIYLIVDVLGKPFRKDLLDRFAQLQLIPYEKMFKQGSALGIDGLEHVEKRFSWFKRLLQVADTRLGEIFPQSWNLGYHLFCEFSRRTRIHLSGVLEDLEKSRRGDAQGHVALLLKALKVRAVGPPGNAVSSPGEPYIQAHQPPPLAAQGTRCWPAWMSPDGRMSRRANLCLPRPLFSSLRW